MIGSLEEEWDNLHEADKDDIARLMKMCGLLREEEELNPQFPEPSCEELCLNNYIMGLAFVSTLPSNQRQIGAAIAYERYKVCIDKCSNT
ncbi:hypothetical protein IAE22_25465 [Bacillus sp. S34]|nr:hypothetical protein [Bacillus sp. S34]